MLVGICAHYFLVMFSYMNRNIESLIYTLVSILFSFGCYIAYILYKSFFSFEETFIPKNRDCIFYYKYEKNKYCFPDRTTYYSECKSNDGKYIEKGNHKNGMKQGLWYTKEENCELFKNYTNGELDGQTKFFINGTLIYDTLFSKNNIVDQKQYNLNKECVNLPDGEIIVWKACLHENHTNNGTIEVYVKLKVPTEAKRVTVYNKLSHYLYCCANMPIVIMEGRVEYAYVEDIIDKYGRSYKDAISFVNDQRKGFLYKKNEMVYPQNNEYDDNPLNENSSGINVCLHKEDCNRWFRYI